MIEEVTVGYLRDSLASCVKLATWNELFWLPPCVSFHIGKLMWRDTIWWWTVILCNYVIFVFIVFSVDPASGLPYNKSVCELTIDHKSGEHDWPSKSSKNRLLLRLKIDIRQVECCCVILYLRFILYKKIANTMFLRQLLRLLNFINFWRKIQKFYNIRNEKSRVF